MKKIKAFIISMLSVILVSSTMYTNNLKVYAKYDEFIPFYIDNGIPNYGNIMSVVYPQVFNRTPLEIWDLFIQEGIKIYVMQSAAKFNSNGGAIAGTTYGATVYYNTSSKKIYNVTAPIEVYVYSNTNSPDAFFHECGHALDYIAEYITGYYKGNRAISTSSQWQTIFSKYAQTMASFDAFASGNMGDSVEGFAEAYRLYLRYPQQLKSFCPEVYSFVDSQIVKYTAYVPEITYNTFDYVT